MKNKTKDQLISGGDINKRQYNIMASSGHNDIKSLSNSYYYGYKGKKGPDAFKSFRGCGKVCVSNLIQVLKKYGWFK